MFNKRTAAQDEGGKGEEHVMTSNTTTAEATRAEEDGCPSSASSLGSSCSSSLSTFTQQVAGHKGENQMLLDESGHSIFKPLNANEARFYRALTDLIQQEPSFPAHFFPRFLGTTVHNGREYIQLENLTYGMKEPCVCDLKMGGNSKGTNPDAGIVKGIKQGVVKHLTTSRTLGFRIVGLRAYQKQSKEYTVKSMLYGTTLRASSMTEGLTLYLNNGQEIRSDVIPAMLKKIDEIIAWMEVQDSFIFRSSSILLLYDGDGGDKVDVKMIDFAHSYPQEQKGGVDEEYLFGMRNLHRILDEVYRSESIVGSSTAGGLLASTASERRRSPRRRHHTDDSSEWLEHSDISEHTDQEVGEEKDPHSSDSQEGKHNTSLVDRFVSGTLTPQRQASSHSIAVVNDTSDEPDNTS